MVTRYDVALFVCIPCWLEVECWLGCAFDLTHYGLAPGQDSCGRLCERESADPKCLLPSEFLCLAGQQALGLSGECCSRPGHHQHCGFRGPQQSCPAAGGLVVLSCGNTHLGKRPLERSPSCWGCGKCHWCGLVAPITAVRGVYRLVQRWDPRSRARSGAEVC